MNAKEALCSIVITVISESVFTRELKDVVKTVLKLT
jgi:hypothetical protein